MTPWMRRIHKWVGLLIGIQFVLWMASGVVMSLFDAQKVQGREFRVRPAPPAPWPETALPVDTVLANAGNRVRTVSTGWLSDRPIYVLADGEETRLVDATNGKIFDIDAQLALQLARASYSGKGLPGAPIKLGQTLETRSHPGPVWKVDFLDAEDTSVYLSAQTGQVLEHRNRTWRLFDVFWMFHIMDYFERKDFNNPLVITSAVGGLWLAMTGLWLLITSFSLPELIPSRWRGSRELTVYSADGVKLKSVVAPAGDTVYVAMARHGMQLPSNCGGGQSCGLCEVRIRGEAPAATSVDRAHLTAQKVGRGYRLACNLKIDSKIDIEVVGGAETWTEYQATVSSISAVTPFLREIVLQPRLRLGPEFRPGAYIQIHVPYYSLKAQQIAVPDHHLQDWKHLNLAEPVTNTAPIRRSYSLSSPPEQSAGRLTLLVRFLSSHAGPNGQSPGLGSTYLYALKQGDTVSFSGPFGEFCIKPEGREKVFIGGGAGMAPLRAMVRSLLDSGAREPIHFWYGARSLREAPYVDEMSALASEHPNFHWHLVLSEEAEYAGDLLTGLVHEVAHDVFLRIHPHLHACDFYLCGPPAMLAATRQLLQRLRVDEDRIAFDDFKV